MPAHNGNRTGQEGATLMEIIIAMVVIGLVSSGIVTAFVFSRRVTHRSGSELSAVGLVQETTEALRGAVAAPLANGLTLTVPGIYVDQNMQNRPAGSTQVAALNFPAEFTRYQTAALTDPAQAAGVNNHGDGRIYIVEEGADLDGDGFAGLDVDNSGTIDLRRVKVRIQWTTTNVQ